MKLKNKKTGETVERVDITIREEGVVFNNDETYNSLAELNAEWEDVPEEEPKGYWFIDCAAHYTVDFCEFNEDTEDDKEIGNYFETKEEAERASNKAKAWKRLKDTGFRFNKWEIPEEPKTPHIKLIIEAEMDVSDSPYDLDLLFGVEK